MARAIDKDYLLKHKRKVKFFGIGSDDESWGYAVPTEVIEKAPTLTPPNEWVGVEERLPDKEAKQYIQEELNGIGYLYPCLLTYRSPNTERTHVVRFYYDITQKWFVNLGENLCEKDRCIAWMPLPDPPDCRQPEEGCEIKDYAETCEECRFCDTTLASPPEGEEDT